MVEGFNNPPNKPPTRPTSHYANVLTRRNGRAGLVVFAAPGQGLLVPAPVLQHL
jgi:hypothetical protein